MSLATSLSACSWAWAGGLARSRDRSVRMAAAMRRGAWKGCGAVDIAVSVGRGDSGQRHCPAVVLTEPCRYLANGMATLRIQLCGRLVVECAGDRLESRLP